eukprot:UN02987
MPPDNIALDPGRRVFEIQRFHQKIPDKMKNGAVVLCQCILQAVKGNDYAWPFSEPVDWREMNLPDYPRIIKKPMDFGTIERKLKRRSYRTTSDFFV